MQAVIYHGSTQDFDADKANMMMYLLKRILDGGDGAGNFDPELAPYLIVLNSLPDLYTLQSCTGHRKEKGYEHEMGNVWFRVRNANSFSLSDCPFDAEWLVDRERCPIISVNFPGKPAGTLHDDMMKIIEWCKNVLDNNAKSGCLAGWDHGWEEEREGQRE